MVTGTVLRVLGEQLSTGCYPSISYPQHCAGPRDPLLSEEC